MDLRDDPTGPCVSASLALCLSFSFFSKFPSFPSRWCVTNRHRGATVVVVVLRSRVYVCNRIHAYIYVYTHTPWYTPYTCSGIVRRLYKHNNIEPLTLDDIETRADHRRRAATHTFAQCVVCTRCFDTWLTTQCRVFGRINTS